MFKKICFAALCLCAFFIQAQERDSLLLKNGIENPSLLPTHHFGIFSSRINTNFKYRSSKKATLSFEHTSGNNFHPFVEAYFPKDPEVRRALSQTIWHNRNFTFVDQETTPADYLNIVIDVVIKEFRVSIDIPINKQHELTIAVRTYLITKGKYPFSLLTSDESIEWFHSNLIGGEDPFGRRYYGLNQVNFTYQDRNGNTLNLNNNDFFVGGLEFSYYYYPKLAINETKNIYLNFGTHLGWNTSRFNASMDAGISANVIKKHILKNNYELNYALGVNVLRKNVINFKEVIDLGNNQYIGTLEAEVEITKYTKKGNFVAFGVNYQKQSSYNKREEADYFKLLGKWREINAGWQNGVFTLYEYLDTWNFICTYGTPKFILSAFLKEDFLVNNAPDLQLGVSLKVPIAK